MPSQIKDMLSRHRAGIARGLILVGAILVVLTAWSPVYRYFADHTNQWRVWLAVIAAILVFAGLRLVTAGRSGKGSEVAPPAGEQKPGPKQAAGSPTPIQQPRDWVAIMTSSLPGLAALIALIFTSLSVQATKGQLQATQQQLQISEQGQITDRYNAAIANLGSSSVDTRLGGVYALQRLMQDSPRDQPTVIAVLCAFARSQSAAGTKVEVSSGPSLLEDIQAALTVVGTRDTADDDRVTVIDLNHAPLADAQLEYLRLAGANLTGADLTSANLNNTYLAGANLTGADLTGANLDGTLLAGADLYGADLTGADPTNTDLSRADLSHVNLADAVLSDVNLTGASLSGANLTGAVLAGENLPHLSFATANLTGADLSGANLTQGYLIAAELAGGSLVNADLSGADLTGADLTGADIRYANLEGANLSYVNFTGANLFAVSLTGANLTNANLTKADLNGYAANLAGANLTNANLTNANLTEANLEGADLSAARFTGANLTDTYWPHGVTVPEGWQRIPDSDRLERAGHQ
jgi:uncharacterized protein YjbI with pentapeptide repeats